MNHNLQVKIAAAIARAPDWIRKELQSGESATRARAEEALAAMVAEALNPTGSDQVRG